MKTSNLIITLAATLALTACGGNKIDPTKEYPALKNSVPLSDVKKPEKVETYNRLFSSAVDADMDFVEGSGGQSYKVVVKMLQTGVRYDLTFTGLPSWIQVSRTNTETWTLTGSPTGGIVPLNQSQRVFSFRMKIQIVKTEAEYIQKMFANQDLSIRDSGGRDEFKITVRRTTQVPTIVGISEANGKMKEGEVKNITIEAQVPGSHRDLAPEIEAKAPTGHQNMLDGSNYFRLRDAQETPSKTNPELLANGNWRFHLIVTTHNLWFPKIDQKATSFNMGAIIKVRSGTGIASTERLIAQEVTFVPGKPSINWSIGNRNKSVTVDAGVRQLVEITVYPGSTRAQYKIDTDEIKAQVESMKDMNATHTCGYDNEKAPTKFICTIEWTRGCGTGPSQTAIKVTALSQLGDLKEKVRDTRTFIYKLNSSTCVAEKAATPPAAPKPAKPKKP